MRFDIETFTDQLVASLKTNLAGKITAINAEKADAITLKQIPDPAWYFESFDDANHNYDSFMFYQISDMQTTVAGPQAVQTISFEILMFMVDPNDATNLQKKILRYWRCIQDAAAATWDDVGRGYDRATIKNLMPISLQNVNSSIKYKVFGVSLEFTIV